MLWVSTGVFVIVVAMIVMSIVRGRRSSDDLDRASVRWGEPFVAISGVLIPFLILAGFYVFSLREMDLLAAPDKDPDMTVDVIGHDWWWEIRYSDVPVADPCYSCADTATTANELHIPVGEVVRLNLSTADVIHSFWVPELQVKQDQIPGHDNHLWLEADEPGTYRGQCAEFCGLQHANMVVRVIAQERSDFDEWLQDQAQTAAASGVPGEGIFMTSSCAGCHTIRGTTAKGQLGPDLTHVASRTTIAGILPTTRENLLTFVAHPQDVKPGVTMPPAELEGTELQEVIDYLQSLR